MVIQVSRETAIGIQLRSSCPASLRGAPEKDKKLVHVATDIFGISEKS